MNGLVIHAVTGVVDVVEGMHSHIARLSPPVGPVPPGHTAGRTSGLTGWVYRGVRGVTRGVGRTLDHALRLAAPWLQGAPSWPQREAVQAALNGAFGDHMAATGNELAITMQCRQAGQALRLTRAALTRRVGEQPGTRLVVLVHGLCMNDLQWSRKGHDHGAALAADEGFVPLYLHYNTGLHIGDNGASLHGLLAQLVEAWPMPVRELVIVGHSMGGLVSLSACHQALQAGPRHGAWLDRLSTVVTLGSPHQGASLEKAGAWASFLLGISPYTAPLAGLARARSAGIQDLRHGALFTQAGRGSPVLAAPLPLPPSVKWCALASSRQAQPPRSGRLKGDGLVSVASALALPGAELHTVFGPSHFDLLSDAQVYAQLRRWVARPSA